MRSRIYVGELSHARVGAIEHRFAYPVYVYVLDLDELPLIERTMPWFGSNRARPVALYDRDYLGPEPVPLREKLLRVLEPTVPRSEIARIELVTMPRFFGHAFNPVSFHYAYDAGDQVRAIVAEVNNTFGERHVYVLDDLVADGSALEPAAPVEKRLFVSPFYDVSGAYRFSLSRLEDTMDVRIVLERDGRPAMLARLAGERRPLTTRSVLSVIARQPFSAALTVPRIAWQAARLRWRRGLPMFEKPPLSSPHSRRTSAPSLVDRFARGAVERALGRIRHGAIELQTPDGVRRTLGNAAGGPSAILEVSDWRFYRRIAQGGDIGLGEAFTAGEWRSPDPVALLGVLARNRDALEDRRRRRLARGPGSNTPRGSRENIRRHYDLGNDFFRLFLDPTLTYSSARFAVPGESLEDGQARKIDLALAKAGLAPGNEVLEMGSGWGALALRAAERWGCRMRGITLSREQHSLATARAAQAGLAGAVQFDLADYRTVEGSYDAVISIEMLEAVGPRFYPAFFRAVERALKPGARAVLQVILIPDARFEGYAARADWVQKHIFPGGMVPSLSVLLEAARRSTSLALEHFESFGLDYARTLALWRERLLASRERALALGYGEAFLRTWEYYLAYCEAGFRERELTVAQLVFARPKR